MDGQTHLSSVSLLGHHQNNDLIKIEKPKDKRHSKAAKSQNTAV